MIVTDYCVAFVSVQLNICGNVKAEDCSSQKGDVQPAVCTHDHVLGTSDSLAISYSHEDLMLLTYSGLGRRQHSSTLSRYFPNCQFSFHDEQIL